MKRKVSWCDFPVSVPGISVKYWNTETAFQIYCATWLRKNGYRFHHSANERLGARSGLLCKLKGQSKGMPDIIIFGRVMVAIELKVNGKVSPEQADWLRYLESIGWCTTVCRTFGEFEAFVINVVNKG